MRKGTRRYRIKSKFRFITFIIIAVVMMAGITSHICGFDVSKALTNKPADSITVTVAAGDTIWGIAESYISENTDPRQAVYDICHYNNIPDGNIYPGMVLTIPENL